MIWLAIPILIVLAALVFFAASRRKDADEGIGTLSRETVKSDQAVDLGDADEGTIAADLTETDLPGVGTRYDFACRSGVQVGVIVRHSGRRELVVYDAETTHGGSGGPVLDLEGRVVAVNAAILTEFGGSNMGVPAIQAAALLQTDVDE